MPTGSAKNLAGVSLTLGNILEKDVPLSQCLPVSHACRIAGEWRAFNMDRVDEL